MEQVKSQPIADDAIQCPPQEEGKCCQGEPEYKIWVLDYRVSGVRDYRGIAVVSAEDANIAIRQFKADSMHNGNPNKIIVREVQQVPFPLDQRLLFETYMKIAEDER